MKRKEEKVKLPTRRPGIRITICPPGVAQTMPFQSCQFDRGAAAQSLAAE